MRLLAQPVAHRGIFTETDRDVVTGARVGHSPECLQDVSGQPSGAAGIAPPVKKFRTRLAATQDRLHGLARPGRQSLVRDGKQRRSGSGRILSCCESAPCTSGTPAPVRGGRAGFPRRAGRREWAALATAAWRCEPLCPFWAWARASGTSPSGDGVKRLVALRSGPTTVIVRQLRDRPLVTDGRRRGRWAAWRDGAELCVPGKQTRLSAGPPTARGARCQRDQSLSQKPRLSGQRPGIA